MSVGDGTVETFLERQREMYLGGDVEPVAALMDADIVWHVPGSSPIAGDHRGREAVIEYFMRRRELAGGTMKIIVHGQLDRGDVRVQLADGEAVIDGRKVRWRTVGVYRVAAGKIAEAWLIPLDLDAFDRAWSSGISPRAAA